MTVNELSYQALADLLAEFEITGIPNAILAELEAEWTELPPEALESLDKMTLLLTAVSMGHYDYQTGQWTPTSDKVYSFDMEAFDVDNMYNIFFQGIMAISRGQIHITDVAQNDGEGYYDRTVSFSVNGAEHKFKAEFGGDWYDIRILDCLNQILAEQRNPNRLYFTTDGYQQMIVFFCNEEWANDFGERTDCRLVDATN